MGFHLVFLMTSLVSYKEDTRCYFRIKFYVFQRLFPQAAVNNRGLRFGGYKYMVVVEQRRV